MKLCQITENEYEGLEDEDEFEEGCIYCNSTPDVATIIQFGGEDVCVDCIEDRPTYEWLRHDPELTEKKLFKLIEDALTKDGHAFGIGSMRTEKVRHGEDVVFDFTSEAKASYYKSPEAVADIIAARIVAARNAASTARGW